ncbi:hypothetical protein HDU67_009071 [Dinochytrium kinnereticum]|nr:hypothetical protein HDU67_009071 [Dinochytrium kinnereticum]
MMAGTIPVAQHVDRELVAGSHSHRATGGQPDHRQPSPPREGSACGMDLLLLASELLNEKKVKKELVSPVEVKQEPESQWQAPRKNLRIWEDEVDDDELKHSVKKSTALGHMWSPVDAQSDAYQNNYPMSDATTPPQSPYYLPSPSSTSPMGLSRSDSFASNSSGYSSASSDGFSLQGQCYENAGSDRENYIPSTTKQVKRYPCKQPGCNRSFTRLFNLKAHMETHNPDRERSFKCEHCGVAFCRAQDLLRHGTVHDKTNLMVCPACPTKTFSRKDALRRHIRVNGCCPMDSI